ncbi:MAG: SDR family NAD(P)-dependent oxidoreductase [Deltaproteobacteria bacterium]|nr:SDR family NAD(P)-dependent oxidoreductase [Deltaproteobacteria bacterium]
MEKLAIEQIETALMEDVSVEDCAVLERFTVRGEPQLVAYIVPQGAFLPKRLNSRLQEILPAGKLPDAYVTVACMPLNSAGEVDEQALVRVEVIDSELVKGWEMRLKAIPEIEEAVVVVGENPRPLSRLHLSDVLSEWQGLSLRTAAPLDDPEQKTAPREKARSKVPAISHGEGLGEPAGAPRTLPMALRRATLQSPAKGVFYIQEDGSESFQPYPKLLEEAARILAGLRRLGLKAGDKVIFQLDRNEDFISSFWSCALGGFVPAPISIAPGYDHCNNTVKKLCNAWLMLGEPLILTSEKIAPAVSSLSRLPGRESIRVAAIEEFRTCEIDRNYHVAEPDDLALLLLTSGSTGVPKAVMQSHRSLLHRSAASAQINRFSADDVSLNWFPLDHVGGIVMFHIRDVYLGCQQIQADTALILGNPLKWLDLIERRRATITWAPNFAYALVNARAEEISARHWDLSSMRFILNGGEAIVAKTARKFLQLLSPHGLRDTAMHPAWGMSETSSGVTYSHRFSMVTTADDDPFVEVGGPIPGVSLRIVDNRGEVVEEETIGSLEVMGIPITSGYYNNPELNREVFTGDGWFKTGDLGFLRGGRLTITGREKDVVIINGMNYYSHEIEAAVEEIKGVEPSYTAACAIREPGAATDRLAVFFSPSRFEDADLLAVINEVRAQLVKKVGIHPDYLVPVKKEEIPKTAIGKIQRSQLGQRFVEGNFDAVLKRLDILTESPTTLPDWFYRRIWRRREAVGLLPAPRQARSLVFVDRLGLGEALCIELEKLQRPCIVVEAGSQFAVVDHDHYRIDPGNTEHYRRLIGSLLENGRSVDQVLHLWTYDDDIGEPANVEELERFHERGTYSLLFLVQALFEREASQPLIRVYVISTFAQKTSSDDAMIYAKGPLLGFIRSFPQEMPGLHCRHIDLPLNDVNVNVRRVLRELTVLQEDREVAYRQGQRLVTRLKKIDFDPSKRRPLPFTPGGMYLMTGGLGGIGVEIGKYLIQRWGARLVLVGRTPLPDRKEWAGRQQLSDAVAQRIQAYLSLEGLGGELSYEAVDVCDLERVRDVVERAKARWHCGLDGVIHLAGTYHEKGALEESRESLAEIFRPKISGTLAVHQLLKNEPDALFIGFSSLAGSFGGAAVSAYAAANSFLDAFVLSQSSRVPRYYSFAWSAWQGVGVSRQFEMERLLHARGYQTMKPEEALNSLLAALHTDQRQLLIGLDGTYRNVRRQMESASCELQKMTVFFTARQSSSPTFQLRSMTLQDRFGTLSSCEWTRIEEMPLTQSGTIDREKLADRLQPILPAPDLTAPRNDVERRIAALWREILSLDQVSVRDNFFDVGGDSLSALRLLARVRDAFQTGVSLRSFFESPTVAGLADIVTRAGAPLKESAGALGGTNAGLGKRSRRTSINFPIEK